MKIKCNCPQDTHEIIVEADYETDPLWCENCGANLDIDVLPVSQNLMKEVEKWAINYGEWMDWENDRLMVKGEYLEMKHNEIGQSLTMKIKEELEGLSVVFKPSGTAELYKKL
ncbi:MULTISPECIES: hypothetical protein [Peribacillus]|uniref:Uncharacterized protein n=1 Tax=Peribacillus simplex TaxID=1478 RepID=A0A120GPC2_9BACI|nr:hypothetical protein [Peribacillus simplex]KWW17623.1 hypothetical protein AS888_21635 [Peribacillus simplex]